MSLQYLTSPSMLRLPLSLRTLSAIVAAWVCCATIALGQQRKDRASPPDDAEEEAFQKEVQPILKEFCWKCHNAEIMKKEVRLDDLTATPQAKHLPLWKKIAKQV